MVLTARLMYEFLICNCVYLLAVQDQEDCIYFHHLGGSNISIIESLCHQCGFKILEMFFNSYFFC